MEVASGLYLGERLLQQDSVATHHHVPSGTWLLALSDGIGGAGNGHLASRLIVRTAMTSLKSHIGDVGSGTPIPQVLMDAATAANRSLASAVARHPDKAGMGGTILLATVAAKRMHYLSIGDSLIYRLRGNNVSRLNKLHSLAGDAETLAAAGKIDSRSASTAAMRSTLTAALTGEKLARADLPESGVSLARGDVILLASDGIETLLEEALSEALSVARQTGAPEAASNLISRIEQAAAPKQDNVSVTVVAV